MNAFPTYKVVVAIGLVAVFGAGFYKFVLRAEPGTQIAHNAPAVPLDQNAADITASTPSVAPQLPSDETAKVASAPSTVPAAVAPAPVAPLSGKVAKDADSGRSVAKSRSGSETPGIRVASAAGSNVKRLDQSVSNSTDVEKRSEQLAPAPSSGDRPLAESGATTDTQTAAAQHEQQAATSREPEVSDSQITTSVRSEIATAAPIGNIGVNATNGVVTLTGTVPSEGTMALARQAAQRVAGVKYVDVSALKVSDQ